jgi:hypothetical protein
MAAALTTLVSFDGPDGSTPKGDLIADANGDLFGTISSGGAYGYGMVFENRQSGRHRPHALQRRGFLQWTRHERNASRFLRRDAASGIRLGGKVGIWSSPN